MTDATPQTGQTGALLYEKDAYSTEGKRLLGRQAAGESFLRALVRYGQADTLFCFTRTREAYDAFCRQITPWANRQRRASWLPAHDLAGLARAGTLHRPDPDIGQLAWQRRFHNQRTYSVCGVTHTIASKQMQQTIGDLLLSPVQSWDAVICTSQAVRSAYARLLEDWGGYLEDRIGRRPVCPVQLPIIPLGIDCTAFPRGEQAGRLRAVFRERLGIGPQDVAVLFVGRLIFYAKAHPVPLWMALERSAQKTSRQVHLIQAGWFENQQEEEAFRRASATFAPSVKSHFVDGRAPEVRFGIWPAADLFVSLSDNIQETFGLTPLEAMANGLPVVVTDWNGYRESVREGIDGFKVAVTLPPPGTGLDLAADYLTDHLNYSAYMAHPCMATAVDADACTRAFITLIEQPDLRRRMGDAGRERAESVYDWQNIIPDYEALWRELADRRQQAGETAPLRPGQAPHPLCQDPFALFAHYTPTHLDAGSRLMRSPAATMELRRRVAADWMGRYGGDRRLSEELVTELLKLCAAEAVITAGELLEKLSVRHDTLFSAPHFYRTLGYLLKFELLRLAPEQAKIDGRDRK